MSKKPSVDFTHGRSGSLPASRTGAGIDPGHEPPLNSSGGDAEEVDRRDVNLRWLGASVLTGITGGALIGASIYIALEGATISARAPERSVVAVVRPGAGEERATTRKGDRLNRTEMVASARQGFKAPMTIRAGNREVIKVRQFVRIATNLSQSTGTYATDIPPFNPLRLFTEDTDDKSLEPPSQEVADVDVSVMKNDLTLLSIGDDAPHLSDADVGAILDEERRMSSAGRSTAVPIPAQQMLSRTLRQPDAIGDALGYAKVSDSPFSGIEVRVVPENVTNLAKAAQGSDPLTEDRDIVLRKGDTLESALRTLGASTDQVQAITAALSARIKVASLSEGQRARVSIGPGPRPGDGRQILRVMLYGERGVDAIAATNDRGVFVSVTPLNEGATQTAAASLETDEDEGDDSQGGVRLYDSLYETALKNDLPQQTVEELVRIFGYDLDFQRRVSPGDSLEIFFGQDDESSPPEVLYAALTVGGEARRVYRYQGEDGTVDFFDEAGRSLKKFLIRKPISDGILRSGFGSRRHPILGYTKMHTGVDWANKIGTPILAAGNGTVIMAGWESGYGRRVEIQHANGYVTTYNHQSRFANGIAPGARVKQGQVIGYLGNTGLATGPHLHYEVIVNGHFVDPLKIRLPRGRELDGRALAEFKRQEDQVNDLMRRAEGATRVAQSAELR